MPGGLNLFQKEKIFYFLGYIALGVAVWIFNGFNALISYTSLLVCLFVPVLLLNQIYIFVLQLITSKGLFTKEVLSFFVLASMLIVSYKWGLTEKQRLYLTILNFVILPIMLMVLVFQSVKKKYGK
jgi:hypothetical protein